jgi:hypothetical protein
MNHILEPKVRELFKIQPRMKHLRERLLAIGGIEIVPPHGWNEELRNYSVVSDPDCDALIDHGSVMSGPIEHRKRDMEGCRCHQNISKLWLKPRKRNPMSKIATGYALSDGLWRQHTWGTTQNGTIVDSTYHSERSPVYFGILLQGIEADMFAFKALVTAYGPQHASKFFDPAFIERLPAEFERTEGDPTPRPPRSSAPSWR